MRARKLHGDVAAPTDNGERASHGVIQTNHIPGGDSLDPSRRVEDAVVAGVQGSHLDGLRFTDGCPFDRKLDVQVFVGCHGSKTVPGCLWTLDLPGALIHGPTRVDDRLVARAGSS